MFYKNIAPLGLEYKIHAVYKNIAPLGLEYKIHAVYKNSAPLGLEYKNAGLLFRLSAPAERNSCRKN